MIPASEIELLTAAANLLQAARQRARCRDAVHEINNVLTLVTVLFDAKLTCCDADDEAEITRDVDVALTRADRLLWQLRRQP